MGENVMLNKIKAFERDYALLKDPFKQVDAITEFCWDYIDSMLYTDLCRNKAEQAKRILETIDYPKGMADNLSCFCFYSWAKARNEDTMRYGKEAISLYKDLGDKEGEASMLSLISYINISAGSYDEAFKNTFEAIKLCSDLPSSVKKGWAYYGLAILYLETKDYNAALKIAKQAMGILSDISFTYGISRGLSFVGSIFINQGKYKEAEEQIRAAIPGYRETGHDIGLSRALNDLGVICRKTGDYKASKNYLKECYQIRETVGHTQGIITTSYELGELMLAMKNPREALKWLEISLAAAMEINTKSKEFQIHKGIAEAYKQLGDFEKAYSHLEQFVSIQGAVAGQETAQKLKQIQTQMATEKAEKEAEIERLKNVELKQAHDIIADKNKEIVDSINYAWMIQSALLASDKLLKDNLADFFILFKPKDIVSGDFYWATKREDRFYLAVCDSTGHGVPGAFMSILNATYMNEAINEKHISEPNVVFNHVRQRLTESISQEGRQDGMDGILVCVEKNKLTYSAAYNSPLLISKDGAKDLEADKMPVGKGEKDESFTLRSIEGKKGDMLYLYTDGYADQFGGPNGKKFRYRQFEETLLSIHGLPLAEQKTLLDRKFNEWKGNLEQVDDVLVIGIRL